MVQRPGQKPCRSVQAMKIYEPSIGTLHNSYRTTLNHLGVPEEPFVVANAYNNALGCFFIPYFTGKGNRGPENLSKVPIFT